MPTTNAAREVFQRELLTLRSRILDVAAMLDRVERATGEVTDVPQYQQVQTALQILSRSGHDRAEQIQLVFSRPYHTDWRTELGVQ